jgi:N-acetylneuraminic acid mutarotase
MKRIVGMMVLFLGLFANAHAVPPVLNYAGQVTVNGEAFDGAGLFKFALVNADGTTTYWSNDGTSVDGSEPQASVSVPVNGGLYAVLLGNTAQQGMGAIDPAVFTQHTDAKLRVWFSDGVNGFQKLSPDRLFASVPYAFNSKSADTALNADTAKTADSANIAMAVQAGAITKQMLGIGLLADINATIGMNRLSSEVTEKLNQEKTTNNYNAPSVGSLLAVPYGSEAPAGYSLYQRGEPRLVWEEKAPVSVARHAYDGVEVLGGKIYFVGGYNGSAKNIAERYDPSTNTWETLNSMTQSRNGGAYSVLNSKLYAIAGANSTSVEIFDSSTGNWANSVNLAERNNFGSAITTNGKIYLIGGSNGSGKINKVLSFDPTSNEWSAKTNMPTARDGHKLVWFENRIWAIGGNVGSPSNKVESYDPHTDSWQTEASLTSAKEKMTAWVANDKIYVGGGRIDASQYLKSIEVYDPTTKQWSDAGNLPENKSTADAVVLNDKVYVIGGATAPGVNSNKVFAADLNASVEGVYDLYRKDGDAPVGTPVVQSEYADGSVTTAKIASNAITKSELSEQILKYLKPEITSQPQASTIYAGGDGTVSFSAEGKYLTYQWKKDGSDLTGETNATLNITDANATLHDGNYSVVVSNDFGSVESGEILVDVNTTWSTDGLVGWWPFEGNASDISGNANHALLVNGPTFTDGKIGSALQMDGSDDRMKIPNTVLNNVPEFSISMWFRKSTNSTDTHVHIFISVANSEHTNRFTLEHKGDFGWFQLIDSPSGQRVFEKNIYPDSQYWNEQWRKITLVRDSGGTSMFVSGKLQIREDYQTSAFQVPQNGLWVGPDQDAIGGGWQSTQHLKGDIDDLRIYDRALSAEEVQALYNLGQ